MEQTRRNIHALSLSPCCAFLFPFLFFPSLTGLQWEWNGGDLNAAEHVRHCDVSTRELESVCMCVQQLTDLTVSCQGVDSFRESLETEVRVVMWLNFYLNQFQEHWPLKVSVSGSQKIKHTQGLTRAEANYISHPGSSRQRSTLSCPRGFTGFDKPEKESVRAWDVATCFAHLIIQHM